MIELYEYLNENRLKMKKIKWLLKNASKLPEICEKDFDCSSSISMEDVSGYMDIIESYSSFYNFSLVENIIEALQFNAGIELIRIYKKEFSVYIKQLPISKVPSNIGIKSSACTSISVKLDEGFKKCNSYYLDVLKTDISKILEVDANKLYLEGISDGCVCVTYHLVSNNNKVNVTEEMIISLKDLKYKDFTVLQLQQTSTYSIHFSNDGKNGKSIN